MSAGKVLALIVVVVSFAIVAVAVSWCCWCIRARFFGDKSIQPVKSAATVADTLESSRQKSSAASLPVPAASESKTAASPAAARDSSCPEKQKLSVRLPDVESPQHSKIRKDSHYSDYASQISLEPLVAQNLYQRKSSKLDMFSREHSLLSTSGEDSPPLHTTTYKIQTEAATKARSLEEGLSMARLSERKQSKYDFFSRENSLMETDSMEGSDRGHNQTKLEEELLADLRREGMTVKAPRKLSLGKKELLRGFQKDTDNAEGSKLGLNATWCPPPGPDSPDVAAQSYSPSGKSSKSSKSSRGSKTSKKSHKHKENHGKDDLRDEPPIPATCAVSGAEVAQDDKVKRAKKSKKSRTKHVAKDDKPPILSDMGVEKALVPAVTTEVKPKVLPENPL